MVTKSKPAGYIKVLKDVQAKAGAKICLLEAMSGMQSQAAELLRWSCAYECVVDAKARYSCK